MGKNRPYIPPPIMTPPSVVVPREAQRRAEIVAALENGVQQAATLAPPVPSLAVVASPARVASVDLLADRIVLRNPTIQLRNYVFIFPGTPRQTQTNVLNPAVATIMHGVLICEELAIVLPLADFTVRTS